MKRFLELAFALAFSVVAHAAPGKGTGLSSPVMTNFNKRDFLITLAPGTAPTNIIQLNWGATPNPPAFDLPGNITYFIGGTNLWTNLVGILQPKDLTLPVMITNQLQFGPGTTNVVKRTNGIDVVYVNGGTVSTYPGWGVINTGDNSEAYFKAGGNLAAIYGRSGVSLIDGLSSGNDIRWFNNRLWLMQANAIFGGDTNTTPFFPIGQIHVSTNFIRGFLDATDTNFSWTVMYQPDTNSPMIFDQVTSGTAGASRGFSFRTNGVEVLAVTGTGGPSSAANWTALGSTNSQLTGDAFVHTLLPTNGLQSVSGASATYIGGADIWNMGVNSSSASAIYNNCYSFYNFGTNSAHGVKATNSYSIWNFSLDGLEDAVLDGVANLFGFGADVFWQSQINSGSFNLFGIGGAAGESTLISNSHDLFFFGQSAGIGGSFLNSLEIYLFGNEAGYNLSASASSEIYAFGGLKNATLANTKKLTTLGRGAGDGINGAYTNVVLIGDGATIGATGENQIIAGPGMNMSLPGTLSANAAVLTNGVTAGAATGSFALTLQSLANPQQATIYDTYTDASNFRNATLGWQKTANAFTIATTNMGTALGTGGSIVLAPLGVTAITVWTNGTTYTGPVEVSGSLHATYNLIADNVVLGAGGVGIGAAGASVNIYRVGGTVGFISGGVVPTALDVSNITLYDPVQQSGFTKVLTSTTPADFLWVAVGNTNFIGGQVIYEVRCTDGTDVQSVSGRVTFDAVAKATTVTANTSDVQNTAICTGGSTLTAVFAKNVATNNVFALGLTATTSLTTTNLTIKWRLETPSTFTVNTL